MYHHALLYKNVLALPAALRTPGLDVVWLTSDSFSIDDARSLTTLAFGKSFTEGGQRDIVIVTKVIRFEAQNALLKLFEEPPTDTIFHVVIEDAGSLLPTLRSRFMEVASEQSVPDTKMFDEFLGLSLKERLARIATELGKDDSTWPEEVVRAFATALQTRPLLRQYYPVYVFVAQHLRGPGASSKMLLEWCALSLPRLN